MGKSVFRSERGKQRIADAYREVIKSFPDRVTSSFVRTEFGKTHLLQAGLHHPQTLLLLHGTSSNAASWLGDIPVWSAHYRVVALDMPGEPGLSQDCRLDLNSQAYSAWLTGVLDALGIGPVSIVGMSLGGWAALDFATRYPQRVSALCLIATSGLAAQRISFVFKALPLLFMGDWGIDRVNQMVFGGVSVPQEMIAFGRLVAKHFRPVTQRVPVFASNQLLQLQMPLLYFAGQQDVLLRSEQSTQRVAELLPHAQVQLLQCGHVITGKTQEILDFCLRSGGNFVLPKAS